MSWCQTALLGKTISLKIKMLFIFKLGMEHAKSMIKARMANKIDKDEKTLRPGGAKALITGVHMELTELASTVFMFCALGVSTITWHYISIYRLKNKRVIFLKKVPIVLVISLQTSRLPLPHLPPGWCHYVVLR